MMQLSRIEFGVAVGAVDPELIFAMSGAVQG